MSFSIAEIFGDIDDIDGFNSDDDFSDYAAKSSKKRKNGFNDHFDCQNKKLRQSTWKTKNPNSNPNSTNENSIKEIYAGIRVAKPLISSEEFRTLINGRKVIKLSQLKSAVNKSTNDIDDDWVTIGVVLNKMTKTSKNGKEYSIWNLNDLSSEKSTVSFFLFGKTHDQHWKLPVGAVIGLLNASFLDRNKNQKNELGPITIDDPDKLLHIGTSKDLGHCKAIKKNGDICGSLIMKAEDEFCLYHIKNAFRKFSSKRAEIQSTFSDKEPEQYHFANNFLPNASLNQSNIVVEMKKVNRTQFQDKKQSENENLKKVMNNPLSRSAKTLAMISKENTSKKVSSPLDTKKDVEIPISPQDVFMQMKNSKTKSSEIKDHKNNSPSLAKGYSPGQMIALKMPTTTTTSSSSISKQMDLNKLRAIEMFRKKKQQQQQQQSPLVAKNEKLAKILQKVNASLEESNEEMKMAKQQEDQEKSQLIEAAMQRKSINLKQLDVIEHNAMQQHFQLLEKKEKYENRLAEITELMVKVVTCRDCKYTAPSQSDLCKSRAHQPKFHEVKKRFFQCKHCKRRRFTYDSIFPVEQCQHCGMNSFERTSMINVKTETKLHENLKVRGDEIKYL